MAMSAGAAAAAAKRRQEEEEEEELTPYSDKELAEGWEFKILRSHTNVFGKPESFKKYLEEEGRAGWILVEKFDNNRLRLKRPASARRADSSLDFDPYRTRVGLSDAAMIGRVMALILGIVLVVVGIAAVLAFVLKPK
jgi:hypothetical protein